MIRATGRATAKMAAFQTARLPAWQLFAWEISRIGLDETSNLR